MRNIVPLVVHAAVYASPVAGKGQRILITAEACGESSDVTVVPVPGLVVRIHQKHRAEFGRRLAVIEHDYRRIIDSSHAVNLIVSVKRIVGIFVSSDACTGRRIVIADSVFGIDKILVNLSIFRIGYIVIIVIERAVNGGDCRSRPINRTVSGISKRSRLICCCYIKPLRGRSDLCVGPTARTARTAGLGFGNDNIER